jgi:predicted DNA-binding protein
VTEDKTNNSKVVLKPLRKASQTEIRISIKYYEKLNTIRQELGTQSYRETIEKLIDMYEQWKAYGDVVKLFKILETLRNNLNELRKLLGLNAFSK